MPNVGSKIKLSAVLVGPPRGLKPPQTAPGESLLQGVVRNYPHQWKNFLAKMASDYAMPEAVCRKLQHGQKVLEALPWNAQIEDFVRNRIPTVDRTVKWLSELNKTLAELDQTIGSVSPVASDGFGFAKFTLCEIILPDAPGPSMGSRCTALAERYGAKRLQIEPDELGRFRLERIVDKISGDFIWLVPSGTTLFPATVVMTLNTILTDWEMRLQLGGIADSPYGLMYRKVAVCDVISEFHEWPADTHGQAMMMQHCNYQTAAMKLELLELEPFYGGAGNSVFQSARPWWKRVLIPWRK